MKTDGVHTSVIDVVHFNGGRTDADKVGRMPALYITIVTVQDGHDNAVKIVKKRNVL